MLIKLDLNTKGINQLLREEVKADIQARAERVQLAASEGLQDPAGMLVVDASDDKRARFIVLTATAEAMQAEAADRRLTRAIDAAR